MLQCNESTNFIDNNRFALSQEELKYSQKLTENKFIQSEYNIKQNFMFNINNILEHFNNVLPYIQHFSYDVTRHNSVIIRVRFFNGNICIKEFTTSGLILNNGIEIPNFNPSDEVQVYNVVKDLRKKIIPRIL